MLIYYRTNVFVRKLLIEFRIVILGRVRRTLARGSSTGPDNNCSGPTSVSANWLVRTAGGGVTLPVMAPANVRLNRRPAANSVENSIFGRYRFRFSNTRLRHTGRRTRRLLPLIIHTRVRYGTNRNGLARRSFGKLNARKTRARSRVGL